MLAALYVYSLHSRCRWKGQPFGTVLPQVYYAAGDLHAGDKVILMQDLSMCTQSGYFFGPGNPNNWGKDLEKEKNGLTMGVPELTAMAFSAAAKLHAPYWNCTHLTGQTSLAWLRGAGWIDGSDRTSWETSQANVSACWAKVKAVIDTQKSEVRWDALLLACLEASISKVVPGAGGWDAFQAELRMRPFTLVHGDFHPANFLLRPPVEGDRYNLVLLDWECVGLGSGPQERCCLYSALEWFGRSTRCSRCRHL